MFKDPLLTAARWLINFGIAVCGFVVLAITVALPAIFFNQDRIFAALKEDGKTVVAGDFLLGVSTSIALMAVLLALAIWFLLLLRRIVGTVAEGDPFTRDNATRLSKMGWIAVAAQVLEFPLVGAVIWTATMIEDQDSVRMDDGAGIDGGGIILILVLFILARVFRQGAAMREDLEGTV